MYKSLVVNGCSFFHYPWEWQSKQRLSHNSEISKINPDTSNECLSQELEKYSMGNLISNYFNIKDYLNISSVGKSNESIIRDTKEHIINNNVKNSIFILGLTQESRYDIPTFANVENKRSVDRYTTSKFYIEPSQKKYQRIFNSKTCSLEDYQKFNELRHKVYFSLQHYIKDLENDLNILNEILSFNNSKLVVINNLLDYELDKKPYYFFIKNKYKDWRSFIKSYDALYDKGQHPNVEDHKILAEELINYLKK
jgi:hypothetical protein